MASNTQPTRRRQISLSSSRSVPNLTHLNPSSLQLTPELTLDEATPRTPHVLPLPSMRPSLPTADSADADANASDHDTDAEFNSHYPPHLSRSSTSSSTSSTSSTTSSPLPSTSSYPDSQNPYGSRRTSTGSTSALTRSASITHMPSFAPPFYNRPPTPLPPSPSLTSLLRPSFSATTSRPTTPDESENDTPNDTEAAVAKSARTATTVPRASPKVPTYEYYGFVLYLTSSSCFLIYILWSYLPSPFLHQLGIYYYPNRWWSLAIPAFLVALIVYIYVALACYNTEVLTLPMNSIRNIVDEAANVAVIDAEGRIVQNSRYRVKGKKEKEREREREREREKRTPRVSGRRKRRREGRREGRERDKEMESSEGREGREWDWRKVWSEGTDAVMDVPVGGVCEILYGGK